jgi:hypothetical protein
MTSIHTDIETKLAALPTDFLNPIDQRTLDCRHGPDDDVTSLTASSWPGGIDFAVSTDEGSISVLVPWTEVDGLVSFLGAAHANVKPTAPDPTVATRRPIRLDAIQARVVLAALGDLDRRGHALGVESAIAETVGAVVGDLLARFTELLFQLENGADD